jgi:hypothetical protein
MFRDTIVDLDGVHRVVHEYAADTTIDTSTMSRMALKAVPRALPYAADCPIAADSAGALVGTPATHLRGAVRRLCTGPSSCASTISFAPWRTSRYSRRSLPRDKVSLAKKPAKAYLLAAIILSILT